MANIISLGKYIQVELVTGLWPVSFISCFIIFYNTLEVNLVIYYIIKLCFFLVSNIESHAKLFKAFLSIGFSGS